jgi:putative membrane protein
MSTPSELAGPPAAAEADRRLHPLSWLFVLLQQLRSFAIPLVVLLVTGRGNASEWFGLLGVAVLTLTSVAQYFSYRYRTGPDGLTVRSGILQRTVREIPYERVHTVNRHQTMLHRLFGVTEVRLESAGSKDAEAVMRVLSEADAGALEGLIRERGGQRHQGTRSSTDPVVPLEERRLLHLDTPEVLRLGVISNRGLVVVAALFGVVWQVAIEGRVSSDRIPDSVVTFLRSVRDTGSTYLVDTAALVLSGALLLLALLALVRLLSVLLAVLQFHDFTLVESGRQLRIERGLLTRIRNQLPHHRIQAWRIDETLLHRWFGRQTLRVDSAAGGGSDERGVRHLAPVAPPEAVRSLLDLLLPGSPWPDVPWQAVDPRAWRRLFVTPAVLALAVTTAATWHYGPVGLWLAAAVPPLLLRARRLADAAGYAVTDRTVAVRGGWLSRTWALAEITKLQTLRMSQSPFDRRLGMATLHLDTAGASSGDGILRIRFLPEAQARDLHARIAGLMDRD